MKPLGLLSILMLVGCGHFEEVTSEGSLRGAAAQNPLLAAERLLDRMGLPATSTAHLPTELPQGCVVLVSGQRLRAESPALQRLLTWVADGGHGIVFLDGFDDALPPGSGDEGPPSALLTRFDLERLPAYADGLESSNELVEGQSQQAGEFELQLNPEAGQLRLTGETQAKSVYRQSYGAGVLTLVPEGAIIARKNIGELDHAAWLWSAVQSGPEEPASALLVHGGRNTLWQLIRKHVPGAPWALLGLLVLGLWRLMVRFGPRFLEPPAARLGFEQHVAAVGRFLWKRREPGPLVAAWRERVLIAARPHLQLPMPAAGDLTRAPGFDQAMANRTDIPTDRVRRAFTSEHLDEPNTFTEIISDLQAMSRAL